MGQHFRSDERFVPVPLTLIEDPTLNAYHIATYIAIRKHADFGKETGSFVSDRRGAELAGISERKFRDCRAALRAAGWLEWTGRQGKKNHYIVRSKLTPAPDAVVLAPTPAPGADVPRQEMPHTPAPPAHDLEPSPKAITEVSGSSNELPAGADALTPNGLVEIVMEVGLRGQRPMHWAKQSKAAQRLLDLGLNCDAIVREACRGMLLVFPYAPPPTGRRAPFDVFTLERKLAEALAASADDKPPSDIVERQAPVVAGSRGGAPVLLGGLVEGVMKRARARRSETHPALP